MKVIILCGLPGSGKSTVAKKHFPNYTYINQDSLGSREKCIEAMHSALERKEDVIIDRTNFNRKQRKYWIDVANYHGATHITCVVLEVPEEECIARIALRKGHETISEQMPLEKKREIVYNFNKMFEKPTLEEGFSSIVITRN